MLQKLSQKRNKYYTVTFDSAGGSAVTVQTIEEGQKAINPDDTTKSDDTIKSDDTNKPSDDVQSPQTGDNSMMVFGLQSSLFPAWELLQLPFTVKRENL